MPPIKKFQKEDIIEIAYQIAEKEGMEGINARRIAKELNCSVQPIFHNFSNMDEVKKAVYEKIYDTYKAYIAKRLDGPTPYKAMGLSYVMFAKEYPKFFKIIFMQETDLKADKFLVSDQTGENTIKNGMKFTGLSYEEQIEFHIKVWMFTHGIATLVATKTIAFTDEEIEKLLSEMAVELLTGHKNLKKEKK